MTYLIDERDVQFNLFEYVGLQQVTKLAAFAEHSEDMYKMVINEALKFAQKTLEPINVSGDREGCRMENGRVITPKGYKEAYKQFAENGFIGVDVSTRHGGQGLPVSIFVPMYEFFSGTNVPISMYGGLSRGAAYLIESFGTQELQELFCPRMYSGEWAGTMCLTEPWAGSAVGDLRTTAKPLGDGTYAITGNKIFISSGDHDLTENIVHLVLARIEGDPPGTKGISLMAVPRTWVNKDGTLAAFNDVNCVNIEHKMGIKAQATCSLNFGEAGKCRGYLVGEQCRGMKYMFQMMNEARLLCGLQGLSLGSAAYQSALKYAKERIQGGKTVIIDYPDVRRNLMISRSLMEGLRGLLYKTALQVDLAHKSDNSEVRERMMDRVELLTPICKSFGSDMGFKVTELAMQIYGGYGYISEYPIEQYMRDVKISSLYEGTNGIQALDLLGRKLPLKGGQAFRAFYEDVGTFCETHIANAELKEELAALKKSADSMGQVAMKMAELGMGGDMVSPQLAATPFLEIVAHVAIGHVLLEQAVLSQEKIAAGSKEAFYRNKIRTAKFFVAQLLPNVQARTKSILGGDKSALEMEF